MKYHPLCVSSYTILYALYTGGRSEHVKRIQCVKNKIIMDLVGFETHLSVYITYLPSHQWQ